ncbi:MAG: VTT domain-containing protein [Acidimicrobiales bacterium]
MTDEPATPLGLRGRSQQVPPAITRVFEWAWETVTGTLWGFILFLILIYAIPYGLALTAIGTQARSAEDFAVLGFVALFAVAFASGQPAPTPAMGTSALLLAGFLGASFGPLGVAALAGGAATLGLVVSYGAGATGIGRLLIDRFATRENVEQAVDRSFKVIHEHGIKATFVLAIVPTPIHAWSAVAGGASNLLFVRFVLAAFTGSMIRFGIAALVGNGIEQLLS